jgi:hypothetical protein
MEFKRGQVEWAAWKFMNQSQNSPDSPPPIFRTRFRRLLELDRSPKADLPGPAFCAAKPVGKGNELPFTVFDAFCLCLAMDLLNAGFKQSEVVFLIAHSRPGLEGQFNRIVKGPRLDRNPISSDQYPNLPTYRKHNMDFADPRVFAVFERVETTELFSTPNAEKTDANAKQPTIFGPYFCNGITGLTEELDKMGMDFRHALVVELSANATAMRDLLPMAPEMKRGRP